MSDRCAEPGRDAVEGLLEEALGLVDVSRRFLSRNRDRDRGVARKADGTLVSAADREIEHAFRERIERLYPHHGFVGEEYPPIRRDADFVWCVDPVDGTEDYLRGLPYFGTIVGLSFRGRPLVGVIDHPALDVRCHAAAGLGAFLDGERVRLRQRERIDETTPVVALPALEDFRKGIDATPRFVSLCSEFPNFRTYRTCYAHLLAATGRLDAAVEYAVSPWDLAASRILVEEAGGRYIRFRTDPESGAIGAVLGRSDVVARIAALLA